VIGSGFNIVVIHIPHIALLMDFEVDALAAAVGYLISLIFCLVAFSSFTLSQVAYNNHRKDAQIYVILF